jgi:hypothetical protein
MPIEQLSACPGEAVGNHLLPDEGLSDGPSMSDSRRPVDDQLRGVESQECLREPDVEKQDLEPIRPGSGSQRTSTPRRLEHPMYNASLFEEAERRPLLAGAVLAGNIRGYEALAVHGGSFLEQEVDVLDLMALGVLRKVLAVVVCQSGENLAASWQIAMPDPGRHRLGHPPDGKVYPEPLEREVMDRLTDFSNSSKCLGEGLISRGGEKLEEREGIHV